MSNETTLNVENVKKLRLTLSAALNSMPLSPRAESRHNALAKTNLEQGRMWLGDVLRHLGEPYPYDHSHTPADTTEDVFSFDLETLEGRIKEFRRHLEGFASVVSTWIMTAQGWEELQWNRMTARDHMQLQWALQGAYMNIKQAKFWMGMELQSVFQKQDQAS